MTNLLEILNSINNSSWIEAIAPWITYWQWESLYNPNSLLNPNFKGFNLIKKGPKEIQYIALPPELTSYYRGIDFRYIASYKFNEKISKFAKVIGDRYPYRNLIMLYNNRNELKIYTFDENFNDKQESLKNIIFRKGTKSLTAASYSDAFNKISVPKVGGEVYLPHELFHMSTSFKSEEKNVRFSGFEQKQLNIPQIIGTGINEGYTELMVQKYYGDDYLSNSNSYILLRKVMEAIESIIEKEKMENYYLTANLNGLVNELAQYAKYEDVLKFISSMDFLYNNFDESFDKSQKNQKLLSEQVKFINAFIITIGTNKPIKQLSDNEITTDQLTSFIAKNCSKTFNFILGGKEYITSPNSEQLQSMIISLLKNQGIEAEVKVNDHEEINKMNR